MSAITLGKKGESTVFDFAVQVFIGPFLICCTLALALQQQGNLDLGLLALIGGGLCIKLYRKGLLYSILLLAISSFFKHFFFLDHHFWQFGIEVSAALGFVVSALCSETMQEQTLAFRAQMSGKEQTLRHLEEEIEKTKEVGSQENVALQDKLSTLQRELDDALGDISSLQMLNEVLRKIQAKQSTYTDEILRKDKELYGFSAEIERMKKVLADSSDLAEKERLLQELNQMRVQKEQTHLVNETLARLVSVHSRKAQEAERKESELQIALETLENLKTKVTDFSIQKESLEEMVFLLEGELKDKAHLQNQVEQLQEMIAHLEERLKALGQVQALYLQMRSQFEDKQEVLHQTRVELFHTDTELQALHFDQKLQLADPAPQEEVLARDLTLLERENTALEQENGELTELISQLVHESAQLSFFPELPPQKLPTISKKSSKKKTKKKTKKTGSDQRLLF